MKRAELPGMAEPSEAPKKFGLRVVLHGPTGFLNLLSIIKPRFDGIVAAF